MRAVERDMARAQAGRVRAEAAAVREVERAKRAYERATIAEQKELKRQYVEARDTEVESRNDELRGTEAVLDGLLAGTLDVDDTIDFDSMKHRPNRPVFEAGALAMPADEPQWSAFEPEAPKGLAKAFGKDRHAATVEAAKTGFNEAVARHQAEERLRLSALAQAQAEHERAVEALRQELVEQHRGVDEFKQAFESGDPEAVVGYFDLVLRGSQYPSDFPQHFKLAYVPDSRQLVVEYDLPPLSVVPTVKAFKYVKASDSVTETAMPATQVRGRYASVLAQVTLRTLHELYEADHGRHLDVIVLNGMVDTIDRATGQPVRPCLITVRATKDSFLSLDLALVDPHACLRHLSASVSKSPAELLPVRPVLEFNMVDSRFVQETDVLGELEQRPNLMELTPGEFENLITNLFSTMGLETKQTQASRDGGVDCVAYDNRPIFGGKVVIQAKRYKGTVGVSAVRDLYGTVHNEGAGKGILVTTSGYGPASFDFANGKPLELIDGANLLYLLAEHAGVEARIVPPEDWHDPMAEM
jgi:restriction system protein